MKLKFLGIFFIIFLFLCTNLSAYSYDSYYNHPTSNFQTQNMFADYMNNVRFLLQKNWNPPDFLEYAQVRIVFKLDKEGRVISYNIIESSNNDIYDNSAIDALRKINSFGNFPEESLRETLTVNYLFETSLLNVGMTNFYYDKAKMLEKRDSQKALEYIDLAIKENGENDNSYFLYKKRAEIMHNLGNFAVENSDFNKYKLLKNKVDIKRVHMLKHLSETEKTPYNYLYLAYAYEQIGDIDNAIYAIDRAIAIDSDNYLYRNYKKKLLENKE